MPQLPYHEDNQARKDKAFNDIASWANQYLEGAITETELAEHVVMILGKAGVKFD